MALFDLTCNSPNHSSRTGEPDYVDPLGAIEADAAPSESGMLCPACARLDDLENLDQVKVRKLAEIDARTEELIYQGFEYPPGSGHIFSASPEMQRTLTGTYVARNDGAMVYPIVWSTSNDGANIELENSNDVANFYLTGLGTIRYYKDTGTALKNQVKAATTVEEVRAIVDDR